VCSSFMFYVVFYIVVCVFCVFFFGGGRASVSEGLTLLDVLSTLYYCSVFLFC